MLSWFFSLSVAKYKIRLGGGELGKDWLKAFALVASLPLAM
jgi:hypothetical protein